MKSKDNKGANYKLTNNCLSSFKYFHFLPLLGSPARIYFYTQTTLENIGSTVLISCRAIGFPKPTITWMNGNNDLIVPDHLKYRILRSGDLLIQNVTFEDMGKYKCVASNSLGTDSVDKIFFYPTEPLRVSEDFQEYFLNYFDLPNSSLLICQIFFLIGHRNREIMLKKKKATHTN